MFQLLQTIWLLGVAAISIPVVIHLWNIKEGRTLKIGSILLLSESAKQKARSLKLSELLLLLLRCLLITFIAILLAKPLWKKELSAKDEKGWILMDKLNFKEAYNRFSSTIDSLLNAGFQFHYFNSGFAKATLKDALKQQENNDDTLSYRTLINALDQQVPGALPVHVFTTRSLKRFEGRIPDVKLNLVWHTYTPSDTSSQWLQQAYRTADDSIRITVAHSNSFSTYYETSTISSQLSNNYKVVTSDARQYIMANDTSIHERIELDTTSMQITIYNDGFDGDALYLEAAIDAIQQYSQRDIKLQTVNNIKAIPAGNDWLFWLSEQSIPASFVATNVFMYEKGKAQDVYSWMNTKDLLDNSRPEIYKQVAINTDTNILSPVWYDGFGHPLLTVDVNAQKKIYHFYSRLNPQWCSLPWSDQFAEMIYALLLDKNDYRSINSYDKRIIDEQQLLPNITKQTSKSNEKFTETTDLSVLFWLLGFIIFFAERILSYNHKKDTVYA